jgi:glycosyltransferase 2 family protein
MKKFWKYIKILITIGVFVFFVYYFLNNKGDLLFVLSTPINFILFLFALSSAVLFLNGVFIKIILKSFDKEISIIEASYLSVISSLGNYFLPMRGGAVIKSVYLKKKFDFSYSHFISALYGNYILVFLVNSFVALIALSVIQSSREVFSTSLYVFFALLFVAMLFMALIRFPVKKIKETKFKFLNRGIRIIKNILEGWNIIVGDKKLLLSLVATTFVGFVLSVLLFLLQFRALGIEAEFISVVLYACLSGVSLLVSLTPGSLGIREGIFVITSDILGITTDQVMQLALLDRGINLIAMLFWFILFYFSTILLKKYVKD